MVLSSIKKIFHWRWISVILFVLGAFVLYRGITILLWNWSNLETGRIEFIRLIGTTQEMVSSTGTMKWANLSVSPIVLSVWLLTGGVLLGLAFLFWKKRFSLRSLMLVVLIAGCLSMLPHLKIADRSSIGLIQVQEHQTAQSFHLTDEQIQHIHNDLQSRRTFSSLPSSLFETLKLNPDLVPLKVSFSRKVSHMNYEGKDLVCEIEFQRSLTDVQRSTLFHFYVHWLTLKVEECYRSKASPGQWRGVGLFDDPTDTANRWPEWRKEWENLQKQEDFLRKTSGP